MIPPSQPYQGGVPDARGGVPRPGQERSLETRVMRLRAVGAQQAKLEKPGPKFERASFLLYYAYIRSLNL